MPELALSETCKSGWGRCVCRKTAIERHGVKMCSSLFKILGGVLWHNIEFICRVSGTDFEVLSQPASGFFSPHPLSYHCDLYHSEYRCILFEGESFNI